MFIKDTWTSPVVERLPVEAVAAGPSARHAISAGEAIGAIGATGESLGALLRVRNATAPYI